MLLNQNSDFVAFGLPARQSYTKLVKKRESELYYLFEYFKMSLYTDKVGYLCYTSWL